MPTGQIVSNEQFAQMMGQATGVPMGQPAQQVFQQPQQQIPVMPQQGRQPLYADTPLQAKQQPQQQRPMFDTDGRFGNTLFNDPKFQEDAKRMNLGNLHAMQPQQLSMIAPKGSLRQEEYENMAHDTSEFVKGMMDAVVPLVAAKAYESLPKEQQEALAEKYAKEEAEKKAQEEGFFDTWAGKALMAGTFVGAGYLLSQFIAEQDSSNDEESDADEAMSALATLFS